MSNASMTHFSHSLTRASTPMTFLPTHPPNDAVNSLFATKWQNRSMTPSRWSHSASRTSSRRQSMRAALLSSTILTLDSPMSTPASYTSTLLIDIRKLTYEWQRRIKKTSTPPWTPPNHWLSTPKSRSAVKDLLQMPAIQSA